MRTELGLLCWLMSSGAAFGGEPLVDELLPRVVKVMGLPMTREVTVKRVSLAEAEAILRREVDVKAAARLGETLEAVGLLPAGTKLETFAPDFNRQNVSGFYDLRAHTLFLVADQSDEAMRPIVAHELAHAVQDANADLLSRMRGSDDAVLAFTAVLEGQAQATASLVMAGWLEDQHVVVEGMAGLLSDTTARSAAEAADQAPVPWLGLQLRFPYVWGRALIAASATPDDPVARSLLQKPPASTAEVMTPCCTGAPLVADLQLTRLIPGAKASVATTVGRAALELLGEGLGEGWRGDRLESAHVGQKLVVVWSVAFATEAQAITFAEVVKGERDGAVVVVLVGTRNQAVKERALRAFVNVRRSATTMRRRVMP